MREILFRGKREIDKRWIEGNFITDEQDKPKAYIGYLFGVDDDGTVHDTDITEVIPETVCQYTGLTDKNERKIFEGDIVEEKVADPEEWGCESFVYAIVFSEKFHAFSTSFGDKKGICELLDKWPTESITVIGNIFDNPELIGE